jgi:putative flippase GtrA
VSACKEIGSSASVAGSSSSSMITSITNNYLQTDLWSLENKSSQWKHLPSLRCCAISASASRLIVVQCH